MDLTETLAALDRKEQAAIDKYASLVESVVDGKTQDAAAVEEVLKAAGKSTNELRADVNQLRRGRAMLADWREAIAAGERHAELRARVTELCAIREQAIQKARNECAVTGGPIEQEIRELAAKSMRAPQLLQDLRKQFPQLLPEDQQPKPAPIRTTQAGANTAPDYVDDSGWELVR